MRFFEKSNPHILFFIRDAVPTPRERQDALMVGAFCFRNVKFINDEDNIEPCDFVAGLVPPNYNHIPRAKVLARALDKPDPQPANPPLAEEGLPPGVTAAKPVRRANRSAPTVNDLWSKQ